MSELTSSSDERVLGGLSPADVRVRFCPSPTGNPHVGLVRTALFNWAFARHYGGTVVFRIEDTDATRDTEESYEALLESMQWLGLTWDEGPGVGGPHGPYRQSERMDTYRDVVSRLVEAGLVYESFSTPEEVEARRLAAGQDPKRGYDNGDRDLTDEQKAAFRAAGREPVLRLRMPERQWRWDDLVRGEVVVDGTHVPDFVVVRANGQPLYPLVNPVDDALMGVTHVLRGEDLLSSTPRQIALYEALASIGIGTGPPRFGHLPVVLGDGNAKLSKRDPQSSLQYYRDHGFIPEGLLNYLALLGWSIGEDREFFSMKEMFAAFDVTRVNPNPARFDEKKAEAINGEWIRAISTDDLATRLAPVLEAASIVGADLSEEQWYLLRQGTPLVQERMAVLSEAPDLLEFLFVDEVTFDPDSVAKAMKPDSAPTLVAARTALAGLGEWTTDSIEQALRTALVEELGLKPRLAFGPVRVAVTGRRVSPPLFESLEILGRKRSLERIDRALEYLGSTASSG